MWQTEQVCIHTVKLVIKAWLRGDAGTYSYEDDKLMEGESPREVLIYYIHIKVP